METVLPFVICFGTFFCIVYIYNRITKRDLAQFRTRPVGRGGEGMAPIQDIQARTLTWNRNSTHQYGRSIAEFTVRSEDALLVTYWLGPSGVLVEIDTAEGRWLCVWGTQKGGDFVHVTKADVPLDNDTLTFEFQADANNIISVIKFPSGRACNYHEIMTSLLGGMLRFNSRMSKLTDEGNECLIVFDKSRRKVEIQERAMADPELRDLLVIGCFTAIHNTHYDMSGE